MSPRTGRFWPWFAVTLLAATAAAQGIMLYAATHDTAFAIEPDYYAKAVAWDSTMARERRSLDLGWRSEARFARDASGGAVVGVRLTDSLGTAIRGAHVRVIAIHNLDAAHPRRLTLTESAGAYVAPLAAARPGIWEIRLEASAPGARFTSSLRAELSR